MKLALLSESPADEAALEVLVEAVLGRPFERVHPSLRARGWPSVLQVFPAILRHLHFNTDADGIVVVVDSDDTLPHGEAHEAPGFHDDRCRLCRLRAAYRRTVRNFPPARGRRRLVQAVGLAVPAMEGWYLCGRDDAVTEAAWVEGREAERPPYTRRELKERTYGTDRPSLALCIEVAEREARRHARDLRRLEHEYPGFRWLADAVRGWSSEGGNRDDDATS